jgi:hypothetical protein
MIVACFKVSFQYYHGGTVVNMKVSSPRLKYEAGVLTILLRLLVSNALTSIVLCCKILETLMPEHTLLQSRKLASVVDELMKHLRNKIFVLFQIRNQLEKLANGIHIGANYRLYAVERVRMVAYIKQTNTYCISFVSLLGYSIT